MKILGKINRGLIVTFAVLIAVALYLVTLSISQAAEKPKIKDVCEKYIKTAISYKMLPEKYRTANPQIPQAELKKYIDKMTADLKAFYTDKEQTYKFEIDRIKADLESQATGRGVVHSFKKDIKEYKLFSFKGDVVTVAIMTDSVMDGPNITLPGMPRENIASQTTDTIALKKVDGEWKIVYAELQQPIKMQNDGGMVMYKRVG